MDTLTYVRNSADLTSFDGRSRAFFAEASKAAHTWYDADGEWIAKTTTPETRERFWLCFALYATGDCQLADRIILRADLRRSHLGEGKATSFDVFHTNIACHLLREHRERLAPAAQSRLEALVCEGFSMECGNRRPDYQFHGYNDNMPATATMGLIVGGEMMGRSDAVLHGIWNLRQFWRQLQRRGINSEWNSPTYTPATIHAIAQIAHFASNQEAKSLAYAIEERLWLDLASRFHPGLGVVSGPYSRAYTVDTLAQFSCVSALLWFVLGEVSRPSPLEMFHAPRGCVFHHQGDIPFNIAQMCSFAAGHYRLPAEIRRLFLHKDYPFRSVATAENGSDPAETPACPIRLETYMQPNFSIGSASFQFLDGKQCAPYFVAYRRGTGTRFPNDIGTVFHRLVINDAIPGKVLQASDPKGGAYENSGEQDNLDGFGSTVTLQSDSSVMVLSCPKRGLTGKEKLHRLSEMVIFPSHEGGADEIQVGPTARASWSGEVPHGQWIGCRRGKLLVAIRPLAYSATSGAARITLEKVNHYEVIRSSFYDGPSRMFNSAELENYFGGFVAEHASVADFGSLAEFMGVLAKGKFRDYFWTNRRALYKRPGIKKQPPLELEMAWTPGSPLPLFATINGRLLSWPRQEEFDGIRDNAAGIASADPAPIAFPWRKLEADWGTGHTVGYIGDAEL